MSAIILTRLIESPFGTFGRMRLNDAAWWTVERLVDGQFPCIPAGTWPLTPSTYFGGDGVGGKPDYPTYEIVVPNRSQIKIHVANVASELRGCIAPGKILSTLNGAWSVGASRKAFEEFWALAQTVKPTQIVVSWNHNARAAG